MSTSAGVVRAVGHGLTQEQKRAQIRLQKRGRSIKLSPACCGVHWTEPIERHTTTEGVLIIIQFKLLQGFSLRELSSPTGKPWIATLEYISTIQGYTILYWGIELTQDQEFICLLVQSENPKQ